MTTAINLEVYNFLSQLRLTRKTAKNLKTMIDDHAGDEAALEYGQELSKMLFGYIGTLRQQANSYNFGQKREERVSRIMTAVEKHVADALAELIKIRVGKLEATLDDGEAMSDEKKRVGWLSAAGALMSDMEALKLTYEQSLNGRSGRYLMLLDIQGDRLRDATASWR